MVIRTHLVARSISRSAQEQLEQSAPISGDGSVWRVLAVSERACTLATPEGGVVALVLPEIGDGPFNVVADGGCDLCAGIQPGTPASLAGQCLRIGLVTASLERATIWEPRPAWDRLARCGVGPGRFSLLQALALRHAPEDSLLEILCSQRSRKSMTWPAKARLATSPRKAMLAAAQEGADHLRAGWEGDTSRLQAGVARLAGLGGGLTPAGDDFLMGVMLWAWLAHPAPGQFCEVLLKASEFRTTTLSAAFLRAAAAGECSAPWHRLLATLVNGAELELEAVAEAVVSCGHSSGADALAGFLWMGWQPIWGQPAQSLWEEPQQVGGS